jgi:ligand-binding sensor domain-containing protein
LLTFCLLLNLAACALAAETTDAPRYAFDTYGVEAGLPGSIVNVALQTRDGYLWVGTQSGLGRFDGVRFTTYQETIPELPANAVVLCLLEDRDGALWVGTTRGLIRHRRGVFELVGLKGVPVRALAADAAGQLWVGTSGQGLLRWRGEKLEPFNDPELPPNSPVRALFCDSEGRLWIAIERGRGVLILEREKVRRFEPPDAGFGEILTMCEQPRDTLWFGTQRRQLYRLRQDVLSHFSTAEEVPRGVITDLRPARDGGLWLSAGTLQHVADLERVKPAIVPGLPNDSVRSVYEDREGGVWLSSGVEGLTRMRRVHYRTLDMSGGLSGNNIKNVAEDSAGNLWLSIQNQGWRPKAR